MNRDKARKFIEERMPQYRIVEPTEDDIGNTLAAADAPDADVNETSLASWKKLDVRRNKPSGEDPVDDLRSRFRPRKLQGRSEVDSRMDTDQIFATRENPSRTDELREGKVGLFSVTPRDASEDTPREPQDLIVDEDEGIIGASS